MLERLTPTRLFGKLSIAKKILLGYMALGVLTIIVAAYALYSLQRLNTIHSSIMQVDVPVQEAADKMLDALLTQDTYEKRFLILRSAAMRSLFEKRGDEFRTWLAELKALGDHRVLPIEEVDRMHRHYSELFSQEVRLVRLKRMKEADEISNGELKNVMDRLLEKVRALGTEAKTAQDHKMKMISSIGNTAFGTTAVLWLISIVSGAVAGLVVTQHIASSLHKLTFATTEIAKGNFDYDPRITTADEIGDLSSAFLHMGKRLRQLEEMYLDASPLTRLPGGIAIENVLKKRLESNKPIAFCVLDLDNFKAFNDRYGYANGSEVIKESARVIEAAVKAKGNPDDFIGHVGGDDFVVITDPGHMREVSNEIIRNFDQRIPEYYDDQARAQGYIRGKTRQGVEMDFPIMTISIAIVTNERRKLRDPLEASEIAAELKDYAKTIPKSVYVVDKRRSG